MENILQGKSLVQRANWLIRLRWMAIAGLAIATFVAGEILHVALPVRHLYRTAFALLVYNFLLFDLMRYITWKGKTASPRAIGRIITFQASADWIVLTLILHFAGGIENPFYLYYVFHMILVGVILSRAQSYIQATLAAALFGTLVLLEYLQIVPHYPLTGFVEPGSYREGLFIFGTFFVFATTIYVVAYMTASISEQLRSRQRELEEANALLERKDNVKNEYVLRVTHDIKGHLAAIQSCLDIVIGGIAGPVDEKQMDMIERARRRTGKCMHFVETLLKLTKMKLTGRLDMEHFPLRNIVFNSLSAVERRARDKGITVTHHIDESIDEVYGEPFLIEETLANVLLNAVKYTPRDGAVTLKVTDVGGSALIEIADNGIGIPDTDIERIFEEFYRAENARKVERDGTGLGLSIARQVVERHGGRIWARNNADRGSTFSIELPKKTAGQ